MSMAAVLSGLIAYEAELRDMLARCREKKEPKAPECDWNSVPEGFWMDSQCRLHEITVITRSAPLFPSEQMENQARVEGSVRGINPNFDKAQPKPPKKPNTGDRTLDVLSFAYIMATYRCKLRNAKANEAYYRCRARRGSTAASCRSLFVSMECPEAEAAREALDAYVKTKAGRSGGGGGGGF